MDENQNEDLEILNQEEESDFIETEQESVEDLRQQLENERKARETKEAKEAEERRCGI